MSPIIHRPFVFVLALLCASAYAHKADDPSKFVTTTVSVVGAVEHTLILSVDDLKKLPQQSVASIPIVNHEGVARVTLKNVKGVLLRDILEQAKVLAPNHSDVKKMVIVASASDDYKAVFSWNEIFNSAIGDGVIVFFESDGKAVGDADGRIAMVSSKDTKTGMRHVRWLKSLEVRIIAK